MYAIQTGLIVLLSQLLSHGAHGQVQVQDTPRPMAPPAAKAPSWGPSLYPAPPDQGDAARARSPAQGDPAGAAQAAPPSDRASQRAPRQVRTPRRAVDQVLTPTTRIVGSARPASGYGPAQNALAPPAAAAPARGSVPANCSASGCVDASGQRLGTGVGNAVVTPQGQLCTRGLVGLQCF